MSVLSDRDLSKRINNEDIVIYPFDKQLLTGLGYDLTIGFIIDVDSGDIPSKNNNSYILKSHRRYIVVTSEYVWLSRKYIGTLHARGSLSLKGLYLTSTTVDPNFSGYLLMSIANVGYVDVTVNCNGPLITLIIHDLLTPTDKEIRKTENGELRLTERTIEVMYPDPEDPIGSHLTAYIARKDSQSRDDILKLIQKANLFNNVRKVIYSCWKKMPFRLQKALYLIIYSLLICLAVLMFWTLAIDNSVLTKIFPFYTKETGPILTTMLAAIAAIIALSNKKR